MQVLEPFGHLSFRELADNGLLVVAIFVQRDRTGTHEISLALHSSLNQHQLSANQPYKRPLAPTEQQYVIASRYTRWI